MPCPYFYPVERLDEELWAVPPRLPLLDAYRGECRALATAEQPDDAIMRDACNTGYARGKCPRFPENARADAVRFHVAVATGEDVRLQYVFEKACRPIDHGELHYSSAKGCFGSSVPDSVVGRQATVFMEGYLRRTA